MAGDSVGDARTGSGHGNTEAAGQLCMCVRHVHGRPFVAHVHNADALPRHMVPDRLDVSTLQAEYTVDAARFQKSRDPGSAGQCIGVQVLRCCERLGHGLSLSGATPAISFCGSLAANAADDAESCRWRCVASHHRR